MTAENANVSIPPNLPAGVRTWLSEVADALVGAYVDDLEALILFGSAAEGRMRASSDVNLLIVLKRFDAHHSDTVSEVMRSAAAAVQLHPMFVLTAELQLAAECFAVKFDDIAHRRVLLYGKDPFGTILIPRALLVQRVRQVLLNLTLRLRAIYVVNRTREEALTVAIADSAAPLRRSAHAILELRGAPQESPKAALEILAAELGSDYSEDLQNLSRAREELRLGAGTAAPLVLRLAGLAESLQRLAGALGE
jgi:hypothetical protein